MSNWAVQDAKAKFSELLRQAEKERQIITYRGSPKFEVKAIQQGKPGKSDQPMTLLEALRACPKVPDFKLPRRKREAMRKVKFD